MLGIENKKDTAFAPGQLTATWSSSALVCRKQYAFFFTIIAVYLTIVGLVYKFKESILMHLLFYRNHTYKDYIKSVPKLLRNVH